MSKETFVWDDELVHEYAQRVLGSWGGQPKENKMLLFKQSKMPKKDKDYEVIEIENSFGGKIRKTRDDKSWFEVFNLKSFDGFKINSVKRLSDGEVFENGNETDKGKIVSFRVVSESLCVDIGNEEMMCAWHISNIQKLPPQSKPEQPKEQKDDFLEYLVFQKENHVRENLFERASEWRMVERLYRAYLEMQSKKPIGAYVSIEQIVSDYLSKEKKEQPKRIEVGDINEARYFKQGVAVCRIETEILNLSCNSCKEKFPSIKAAIEKTLNDEEDADIKFAESKGWTCVRTHEYQLKLREVEEKAFNSARETEAGFIIPIHHHRLYTFQNYLIYKSKQDK